jgi:hypothetical protein
VATAVHVLTLVQLRLRVALHLFFATAMVALGTACGSTATTEVTAPSTPSTRCQTSLSGSPTSFGPNGGSGSVTVGVSRECAWSATSQQPWIEVMSPREGQGEGSVSFRVGSNADPVVRRGSILINDQQMDVNQEAAPCSFVVGGTPETIPAVGAQITIPVTTHSACQWTAISESPFATVTPPSGSGSASVQVTVPSNSGNQRTISVVVAGARRTMTQAAPNLPPAPPVPNPPPTPPAPPAPTPSPTPTPNPTPPPTPPAPPAPTPCTGTLSPGQRSFTFLGGSGTVQVSTSAATCSWTATSSASWLTITGAAAGTGNGTVGYLALPNLTASQREATITVLNVVHRVTQTGLPTGTTELEGALSGLSGNCPSLRFTLQGITVTTDKGTDFRGGKCDDVRNGVRVKVSGMFQSDGTLLAKRVEIDR